MSFALDLKKFAEKAGANAEQVVRKATFEVARSVVMKTPVDTGRARSNWQFGDGEMPAGTLDGVDPQGSATLTKLSAAIMQSRVGGVTYVANNLPYALRLEYGWSQQAPSGMVRNTLTEFGQHVRKVTGELDK
ncbi:MAG: HK97 gp10 family phage protein [Alcaligenaceae bacterium]|nr:HK97 gp10 family phage protein [Alcaligenaceae bacterium]